MSEADSTNNQGNNQPNTSPDRRNRNLKVITGVFAIIAIGWLAYWLLVMRWREQTDDAYVGGDMTVVSARVAGTVVAIHGRLMDQVQAGQPLITLDATDAQVRLDEAASALANAVRQYRQQSAQMSQVDAAITLQKVELDRARADLARREPLLAEQAISAEELAHARTAVAAAQAALSQSEHQAQSLHAMLDNTTPRTHPSVLQAKSAYADAWLNTQRNAVIAPVSGYISQHNVQLGQRIQPGQNLLSIVPLNDDKGIWVDANFKESQLQNLRIGQAATLTSDQYGSSVTYHGKVIGIGIGTGAAFALLPPQNAAGNWIKVIQRVPVRIQLDGQDLAEHPLRIGLSMFAKVDTHDRSGPVLRDGKTPQTTRETVVYVTDQKQLDASIEHIINAQLK